MSHRRGCRGARLSGILSVGFMCLIGAARAQPVLPGRAHAFVGVPGQTRIGLFAPAGYVLNPCLEIETHPVVFLAAPHVSVKVAHGRRESWYLAGDYGLALPWLAQKLLQGYFFPSFQRGTGRIGVTLVPSAGALLSHATTTRTVTFKLNAAFGVPLTRSDLRPLEAPAPLEMLFAPVLNRYRVQAGVLFERVLSARWHARLYGDGFLHGVDPDRDAHFLDHLTARAGAGTDAALTNRVRLSLDLMVWNNNQFARNAHGRRVRSTDVLPFLDLHWTW